MNNNQANPVIGVIIGIFFFVMGIVVIFLPSCEIKETLNCDSSGNCTYILQNLQNKVVRNENFAIYNVIDVRKDTVKKDEYGNIFYDSRIGAQYRKYRRTSSSKRSKTTTINYNSVYIGNQDGNPKRIDITTSFMLNKFKKYFEDRKNNVIPFNSEFSASRINIFLILGCVFMSVMGLIAIIVFSKKNKKISK